VITDDDGGEGYGGSGTMVKARWVKAVSERTFTSIWDTTTG
jgi:hypothetical protein